MNNIDFYAILEDINRHKRDKEESEMFYVKRRLNKTTIQYARDVRNTLQNLLQKKEKTVLNYYTKE